MNRQRIIQVILTIIIIFLFVVLRLHSDNLRNYVYDYLSHLLAALSFVFILLSFCKGRMNYRYALPLAGISALLIPSLLLTQEEVVMKIAGSLTGIVSAYALDTIIIYIESRSLN